MTKLKTNKRNLTVGTKVSKDEQKQIESMALKLGCRSIAEFVRKACLNYKGH